MLILFALCASHASAAQWIRATSDHFSLVTDATPRTAAAVLKRFEQARFVLTHLTGATPPSNSRLPIVAVTDPAEAQRFRTGQTEGYYVNSGLGDMILLLGPDFRLKQVHEYVHFFVHQNGLTLPAWLDEGLAEVYSTIEVTSASATVGITAASRLAVLQASPALPMPLAKLFAVTKQSREYSGRDAQQFYAESWALAHMLEFSGQYKPNLPRFLADLVLGASAERAFQHAYSKTLAAVETDLLRYLQQPRLPTATVTFPERFITTEPTHTPLTEPAAALVLADVLSALDKKQEIGNLLDRTARRYPNDPDVETGRGEMALRDGRDSEALAHFNRAIAKGSRNAQTYYDYATLVRSSNPSRFVDMLNRAVAFNPSYFNAQYLLGYTYLRDRKYDDAAAHLKVAVTLSPSRAPVWEQLALAYKAQGKIDDAIAAARMALEVASSEPERDHMTALVSEMRGNFRETELKPASSKSPQQPEEAPDAPLRALHSDASISGDLVQVDCLDTAARLVIASNGKRVFLLVRDPGAVLMKGSKSRSLELQCGPTTATRVEIAYRTRADATYGTAGDVTAVEFK